jgi:Fe-S cluster assembly protein SufD
MSTAVSEAFGAVMFNKLRTEAGASWPAWLRSEADEAARIFSRLGLPDRKTEEWRYTGLNFLSEHSGALGGDASTNQGATPFFDLDAGQAAEWTALRKDLNRWLEESALENMNLALSTGGFFVRVPAGEKKDISLRFGGERWQSPRSAVFVEEGAEAVIFEDTELAAGGLLNSVMDVHLAPGAKCTLIRLQNNARESHHISTVRVLQQKSSRFENFNFFFGSAVSRDNLCCRIAGEGAECELRGLAVAGPGQHLDQFVFVDHASPKAVSRQLFKNLVSERGRAVFSGRVAVREGSHGTDARQLNRNLLLGKTAEVDTRPQLEIDNDDVKCAHGASTGRLNEEEIFYLESRAIPRAKAVDLLCRAFVQELVFQLKDDGCRARIQDVLEKNISRLETGHGH